jgi:hypothetical protein
MQGKYIAIEVSCYSIICVKNLFEISCHTDQTTVNIVAFLPLRDINTENPSKYTKYIRNYVRILSHKSEDQVIPLLN